MFRPALVTLVLFSLLCLFSGCVNVENMSMFPEYDDALTTILVKKPLKKTNDRVLLLDVEGVISEWGESRIFYQTEATTTLMRKKLEKAMRDERIKAVVLRINSPGGTVTATDIVYRELLKYKNTARVPIVAAFMGLATSGAYYLSCAADTITAYPTTITGSIGVMMHSFGFAGLFQKIGMESRVIQAGKMKDVGNPFNEMTDEERAVLQAIVDEAYERFLAVIAEGRPNLKPEEIRALADGRIFTATEAKRLGLVDQIGDLEGAIEEAMKRANLRDAGVILYTTSEQPEQNIYSQSTMDPPSLQLGLHGWDLTTIMDASRPRFYYLWLGF